MRLFIAIPIPEDVKQELSKLQKPVKGVRWMPEEQMHLTLKFVGEFNDRQCDLLTRNLNEILFKPFDLYVHGLGFFPEKGAPRVFWAGIPRTVPLMEIQKRVEETAAAVGAEKDRYSYKPHITLARIDNRQVKREELLKAAGSDFQSTRFTVNSFILYESLLKPGGAVHRPLAVYRNL